MKFLVPPKLIQLAIASLFAVATTQVLAVENGAKAPDFDLAAPTGQLKLSDLKGQYVYVDFWASWCGPCKESFPFMNDLQAKLGPKGLKVVAVNVDVKTDDAKKFLADNPAKFAVAFDNTGATPKAYQVKGMPTSLLIGPDGNVIWTHQSFKASEGAEIETKIRQAMEKK
jgi:cytochrome c biogenesis protein CcmG, thiol:disulfide interchange protein DsbE